MEYCGIDLHQDKSEVCILDESGEVMERISLRTTRRALARYLKCKTRMRVVIEAGGSSPWVSRLVTKCGHEVIVCSPRRVRLIAESTLKADEVDAEVLARLVRIDPGFMGSVIHRSEEAQLLRSKLTVRSSMVEARTKWINTVRRYLDRLLVYVHLNPEVFGLVEDPAEYPWSGRWRSGGRGSYWLRSASSATVFMSRRSPRSCTSAW